VIAAIATDPEGFAVVLQGKLELGNTIEEAGLIAQLRKPKTTTEPE
jgi:hypothetical protein